MKEKPQKQKNVKQRKKQGALLVGDCEDLLPFSWRYPPVIEGHKKSKVMLKLEQQSQENTTNVL